MAKFGCGGCKYGKVCRSLPDDLTCEEVERIATEGEGASMDTTTPERVQKEGTK